MKRKKGQQRRAAVSGRISLLARNGIKIKHRGPLGVQERSGLPFQSLYQNIAPRHRCLAHLPASISSSSTKRRFHSRE